MIRTIEAPEKIEKQVAEVLAAKFGDTVVMEPINAHIPNRPLGRALAALIAKTRTNQDFTPEIKRIVAIKENQGKGHTSYG